ncbi:cytochrome b-c1 complex subunit 10 [Protopterus annectens]|uniref:cytochrome b-c1 complex subunit 10 n=1 Tax=Protopterus annectens TaxID=7888 RepID=UPI001CFB5223|nr:cytochrome b-c1 complex subunit 10 [Protopterus annectens]
MKWVPTAVTWGSVATFGVLFATDWRVVMDDVPYINGKFKKDTHRGDLLILRSSQVKLDF